MQKTIIKAVGTMLLAASLAACGKKIEGSYIAYMNNGQIPVVRFTLASGGNCQFESIGNDLMANLSDKEACTYEKDGKFIYITSSGNKKYSETEYKMYKNRILVHEDGHLSHGEMIYKRE